MSDSTPKNGASTGTPDHDANVEPAPIIEVEMIRQELAVIQFLDRLDHLYRDLLDARDRELSIKEQIYRDLLEGRDREITVKDRLISELERRAYQAEEHETLLKDYISNLPPSTESEREGESPSDEASPNPVGPWWQFWR